MYILLAYYKNISYFFTLELHRRYEGGTKESTPESLKGNFKTQYLKRKLHSFSEKDRMGRQPTLLANTIKWECD